ncbi:MAG TPA: 50S ribosomal protein L1 [Candidatus Saccharimonadales bacterium]|nr:50S ribosomal protein L1 [Candidatus Saccharimonadales bacterium]
MAKTKAELLEEAKRLGIEVAEKAKVAEIKALIDAAGTTDTPEEPTKPQEEPQVAKAGKRSAKALKEEIEKQAKEERKASGETDEKPKKPAAKPARPKLERRAKGYRKSVEQLEKNKTYSLKDAIALAKKTSHVKFDATVELHVNLGVDPKLADQNVRDTLVLPAGSGKSVKVAVFTEDAAAAKKAGADIAGTDELVAMFEKGATNFDILVATPNLMPRLGKYARTLGPRGLMPNPKSGTVTTDIDKAVKEAKAGRVEYRVDSTGIVHLGIGKVSFSEQQLLENLNAVLANIKANKPQSIKGTYLKRAYLTTSMGPSISVDMSDVS